MTDNDSLKSQYFDDIYRLLGTAETDHDERINRALEIGCERLGIADGFVTHTRDGDYEVLGSTVADGPYSPGSVTDLETTWCRHVVGEEEPLSFADADRTDYRDDPVREGGGHVCYIGFPLVVDGETYGTLCFADREPRGAEFTEADRQFVAVLAAWVSNEIQQARHHRELIAQNERLDEFTGVVAHDLKNPLAAAIGYTEMVLDTVAGTQAEHLQTVTDSLERMESLIDGLLLLAKEGADVGERTPVTLRQLAHEAWETAETRDATITVDSDQTIYADRARLRQVFENLFRNAVEHGGPGVAVTVRDVSGGFQIADDGDGLPDGLAAELFDEDHLADAQRNGIGLLIVERVVYGHGWSIRVDSDDSGTAFTIEDVVQAQPTNGTHTPTET